MERLKETIASNFEFMGALLLAICVILQMPLLLTEGKLLELTIAGIDGLSHLGIPYFLALVVTGVPESSY